MRRVRSSVLPRGSVVALVAMLVVVAGGGVGASAASAAVVSVTLEGAAKGSVTSTPAGIDCSNVPGDEATDCSFDFPFALGGIKLSAVAADGAVLKSWTGTAGGTCSGATNPCQTAAVVVNPLAATATFSPKPDKPVVTTGGASDILFPSATLSGTVNPNSSDFGLSGCYFEYGTTTDYGTRTPCRPVTVGPGTGPVAVTASAGSLEPGVVYHYRAVATNLGGSSAGEDQTLTAAAAPADACPNAAIRAQQHVLARTLPNCMAYELVSPPFTLGQKALGGTMFALDGNGAVLASPGAIEDAGGAPDTGGSFYASRTDTGWRTVPLIPPATEFPLWNGSSALGLDFTADGRTSLWWVNRLEDKNTQRYTPVRSDADGNVEVAGPTIDDGVGSGLATGVIATSTDLRTLVISSYRRTFATDGAPDTRLAQRKALYVSRPDADAPGGFMVRQVAFRAGAIMAPSCEVVLGSERTARGAVSADGRRIFFSLSASGACNTNNATGLPANQRAWVRDGAAEPEDLSASKCTVTCGAAAPAYFEGASHDGRRVYFTTAQKLLDSDQDDRADADNAGDTDLYVHDYAYAVNSRLRNVTASGAVGQGAGVLGVVRVSDDGSYVYFVANGRPLAGANARGQEPQAGDNNLYVYHRPRSPLAAPETIGFIGRVDLPDVDRSSGPDGPRRNLFDAQGRPVVTSSDGRFLLFLSYSDLTGERSPGDAFQEPYRYDAVEDELTRIWSTDPAHNGAARTAGVFSPVFGPLELWRDGARQVQRRRGWMISDDGKTVAFSTAERLSPNDVNDKRDAYMWDEQTGAITMLSSGRSTFDVDVSGVSPGGDVFFNSNAALVPQYRSGTVAAYVARRGGGFAAPPEPAEPCSGDGCQGQPTPPLSVAPIGSMSVGGDGNVHVPANATVDVSKLKAVSGASARLRVRVPDAGRISVGGSAIRRANRSASRAGSYSVTVALSARAKKKLKSKKTLKVNVRISYRAKDGQAASKTVSVTFKQPKPKRAKGKKGGR
jgi:hypothetical protein